MVNWVVPFELLHHHRIWLMILTGCHCQQEALGTWMNSHWPAVYLSMEPDVFLGREQPHKLGTNDTNDIAKHREKDTAVVGKNEASPAKSPDG
jgi:hypothetical protein